MNIKEYWKSVRAKAAELDPEAARKDADEQDPALRQNLDLSQKEIWLFSIRNETVGTYGGRVVSAHPVVAARMLKEQTHQLATPKQVSEYEAELAKRREDTLAAERERKGQNAAPQILITQDLVNAVAAGAKQPRGKPAAEQGD
jgi:hypothetical protein